MKKFILAIAMLFVFTGVGNSQTIDLNDWSQQGIHSAGNWEVALDGSSVLQTRNGDPTYFVSDETYIDYKFEGKFKVHPNWDDDYIGFVFGWNGIDDYYLFDWKQRNQGSVYAGFTLSKITDDSEVSYWNHTGAGIEVLDTDYTDTNGWVDGQMYDFTLNYTQTGFTIDIDDTEIFSHTGACAEGNFGFYNNSQENVFYQGFEADENPPSGVPEPATMILLGTCLAGLGFIKRKRIVK